MDIKVNPLKYPNIKCDCGCETFVVAYILKRIPGIVMGTGAEDQIVDLPVYICSKCGKILKEYEDIYKLKENADNETSTEKETTKSGLII